MTDTKLKCWLCDGSNVSVFMNQEIDKNLKSTDVRITDDRYGKTLPLYKCNDCSFVFAYPLPENIIELYENLEDESYIDSLKPRIKEMQHLLKAALKQKPDAKTVLDVGAGVGLMVNEAQKRGLDATGVEPSKWLVQKAKDLFSINIIEGIVPNDELKNKKFDIIFAVDVIEHLSNPLEFLETLKNYLNDSGLLIIATPDCNSVLAKKLKEKWWHFRLAHIGYFNQKSLAYAIKKSGLKLIRFTRQVWYLPFGYLYKRLSNYLPIGFLNKQIGKIDSLNNFPVRLNLRDSMVAFIQK
ncbi:MAG TPA: class I SAM-dependent methyltransferase [Ignavibacteria bacterium]|nr:class I SAM-dependent methyltransferase [Ignavibacteria bacterium]